jgi:hypothetical protein
MSDADLFSWQPPTPLGNSFNAERDGERLAAQAHRVFNVMRDGSWKSLAEIEAATGDPQASISARLRDLRRAGFRVERRYVRDGLHRYRVLLPSQSGSEEAA